MDVCFHAQICLCENMHRCDMPPQLHTQFHAARSDFLTALLVQVLEPDEIDIKKVIRQ